MPRPTSKSSVPPKTSSAHPTSSPRAIMRLELTPTAKRQNEAVADHLGMTQIATLSRLVEWFALQPPEVQSAVLWSPPSDSDPGVARVILERMAGVATAAAASRK